MRIYLWVPGYPEPRAPRHAGIVVQDSLVLPTAGSDAHVSTTEFVQAAPKRLRDNMRPYSWSMYGIGHWIPGPPLNTYGSVPETTHLLYDMFYTADWKLQHLVN